MIPLKSWREMHGMEGGEVNESSAVVEEKRKLELRPANFYQACIYAWNAYREDNTLTSVKYDTKKGLYTVAA